MDYETARVSKMKKVLVVGGGVAGVSAALAAAREGAATTLVESSKKVGLSNAHLPLLLSGEWGEGDIFLPEAESLASEGVEVRAGETVVSVERRGRKMSVSSGKGRGRGEWFDSLVICTGAGSQAAGLRGISKPNVFVLNGLPDYLRLSSALDELGKFVLSGPVLLSMRLGDILGARRKEVRIYVGEGGLSRQFSAPAARMIRRGVSTMAEGRVSLVNGGVDSILGVGKAEAVVSDGSVDTCDAVVIIPRSAPVAPLLACERGPDGGILVDASMSTSVDGVFAAGDSAELRFKSGSVPARLYSTSRSGGEVAGINAAGGSARASPSWAVEQEFFGVEFCSAGLGEEEARAMGLDGASETGSSSCQHRRPDGKVEVGEISVTIVYDRSTHQVYGLQLAGWRASSYSNVASLIVSLGLTVEQIAHVESPYSPGSSYEFSPIRLTAGRIRDRERR